MVDDTKNRNKKYLKTKKNISVFVWTMKLGDDTLNDTNASMDVGNTSKMIPRSR